MRCKTMNNIQRLRYIAKVGQVTAVSLSRECNVSYKTTLTWLKLKCVQGILERHGKHDRAGYWYKLGKVVL